ncbi:MAG TPA: two-component regulator propeller domain-containing protein [Verrucomicrobiae bacterium]
MRPSSKSSRFEWLVLRWSLAVGLLLLSTAVLRADSRLGDYTVTSWTVDNGLPNNSVTCLLQTRDGYLWIGTAKGLVRFDGQIFRPMNLSPDGQQPVEITALFEDTLGQLWIGTHQDGLWCLASGNITRVNERDGFNCPAVTCIAGDSTGDLWIGTTNGMDWFRGTNMLHVTAAQGLPSEIISSIRVSGPSAAWITTRDGMCQFTNGVLSPLELQTDSAGRNPEMIGMFNDQHGNLWAFGDTYLVNLNDGQRFNYFRSGDTTSLRIWSSCEGRDGQLWIGTSGQGLFSFADGRFRPLSVREASLGSDIQSILEDTAGDLWLGTFSSGLVLLEPQRVQTLDVSTGLPSEMANCVAASPDGRIWAGYTDEGLFFRQSEHFERSKMSDGRDSIDLITSLAAGANGELWAGTAGLGLIRFKDGLATRLTTENGLSDDEILAVTAQPDGTVWAGMTDGSINRISKDRIQHFDRTSGLSGSPISCILAEQPGTIIVGAENGWLGRLTNNSFVSVDSGNTLAGAPIRALYEDAAGRLWIGTQGKGLAVSAEGRVVAWDDKHGFPDNEVYGILSDDDGRLWFQTRQGIHVLSPAAKAFYPGQIPALQTVKRFERSSPVVARPGWPQAAKGSDGRLWFAGPNGLCVLDPHDFQSVAAPLNVELENILVDGAPLAAQNHFGFENRTGQPLRLSSNLRSLEIDFTTPCLVSPDQVQFQHKLDNLDKDWVDSGPERHVRYNGLPLGQYQFHVRARNSDGTWGRENAELAFILPPPFWRLPLVITFELALVVALVVALARLFFHRRLRLKLARLSHQEAMERERMRIARDMHDEIGSRLTRISYVSELALQDGASSRQSVLSISHAVHDLLKSLDEIVWAVNPQNDTLENLAAYLGHYITEYLHATAVECKINIPPSLPLLPLTAETRHNVFLAFEEAVSNSLRHSGATCLSVDIHCQNDYLEIRVEDNGRGFPPAVPAAAQGPDSAPVERQRKGNGLANMRQRLAGVGGSAAIESRPGEGTTVTFRLPLKPTFQK